MGTLVAQSPAKINLTLRVGPRRDDGFHGVESLVSTVDLCDTVTLRAVEGSGITISCDVEGIPRDQSNLVVRAAQALIDAGNTPAGGVHFDLVKRIPAGAGLGGGSSNAATALKLLNELWRLDHSTEALARIGAEVGSDVPLFLHGGVCVVGGRGELVADVQRRVEGWVLLLMPAIHSDTAAIYARFDAVPAPVSRASSKQVLEGEPSASKLMGRLYNDLEPAVFAAHPALATVAQLAGELLGAEVRVTGSGSAMYALFDDRASALAAEASVTSRLVLPTHVARFPASFA